MNDSMVSESHQQQELNGGGQLANGLNGHQQQPHSNNGVGNGHNSTVDDHFEFFKSLCDKANEYYLVQKAKGTYAATKNSCGLFERTLDKVEGRVMEATQMSAPIYEHYLFPATDRLLGYYSRSVETSKVAVDKGKNAAVTTGTLGLGLALVATQMGLIAGTAATNLFLDGVIATKNAGGAVVQKTISAEKAIQAQVFNAINATQELAKNPVEKLNEHANAFLDIANTVFERLLNLPLVTEDTEATLPQRVAHLAHRVAGGLSTQANQAIVEPCHRQLNAVCEQLAKSMVLVDYVKKKREWTYNKIDQVSSQVNELRTRVEKEAVAAATTPEIALIRSIRQASAKLNEQLLKLRVNSTEVLNGAMQGYLESATSYVEQLDLNFANADDIYQVKDEVIEEAKQKLNELHQWSSSLIVRGSDNSQGQNSNNNN